MNLLKLKQQLTEFFNEDIGDTDLSSELLFDEKQRGEFSLYAKEDGIFCGEKIIQIGFQLLTDESIQIYELIQDGTAIQKGDLIARIEGPIRTLLSGERVILNLIQRMSAISTKTALAVAATTNSRTRICDTRKTTPGLRIFEKYAVRVGGGFNHRNGLYDCVMLKDNHIEFAGSISKAVNHVKQQLGHTTKIEVEVETKEQLIEAIEAGVDLLLLDNRTPAEIESWLPLIPPHIITEASGGITLDTLPEYAATEIHYISLGALTHSIHSLDMSALVQLKGV